MFKDNKLRLLMTLVGFSRLGEAHDPDASWLVPSSLNSTQLQEAIDLIRKYEFDPPTYEDGKGPEDLLRSKAAAARRSTRNVDFDDDDDDQSDKDRGEYGYVEPTARAPDGERKKLKRRKRVGTPVELDEEERERRAEARRNKELEKQKKTFKSVDYILDSDDDEEADAAFFAREEALRRNTNTAFREGRALESLSLDSAPSKKRKAEDTASKGKRRKTPPKRKAQPFADSDDDDSDKEMEDAVSISSAVGGAVEDESEDEDEATDTPLSSQHAVTTGTNGDTPAKPVASSAVKSPAAATGEDEEDEEEDDVPVVRRPMARNTRAGFIIDSDSE